MEYVLGFDLAGATLSNSGFVMIEVLNGNQIVKCFQKLNYNLIFENIKNSKKCAIDQPFAYASAFMKNLSGKTQTYNNVNEEKEKYLWRETDQIMREIINTRFQSCVQTPTGLRNIWHANMIINNSGEKISEARNGTSNIFETHPKVALFLILKKLKIKPDEIDFILENYKKGENQKDVRVNFLKNTLNNKKLGINLSISKKDMSLINKNHNYFEAFICALVAFWKHTKKDEVKPCLKTKELLNIEGAAWLPFLDEYYTLKIDT